MQNVTEIKKYVQEYVKENGMSVNFPEIHKRDAYYDDGVTKHEIPNKKILVGTFPSGQYVYGVCSNDYQLISYEEEIYSVLQAMDEFPEYGKPTIAIRDYKNFAKAVITFDFLDLRTENKKVGDIISPRIVLKTSADTTWKRKLQVGALILACANGMTRLTNIRTDQKRHYGDMPIHEQTKPILENFMTTFSAENALFEKWAEKRFDALQFNQIWEDLPLPERHKQNIKELPIIQRGGTPIEKLLVTEKSVSVWEMNLATSQYYSHFQNENAGTVEQSETAISYFANIAS